MAKLSKTSEVVLTGHAKTVSGVAWSCDGKRLATASSDLTARVWNVDQHKEGKELELKDHTDSVDGVSWSPTHPDLLATASADKTVRVWDLRARKSLVVQTEEEILNIAYSPDGNLILISDKNESLRLIDARKTTTSSGSMRILAEINFGTTYWVNEVVWNGQSDAILMAAGRQSATYTEKGVVDVVHVGSGGSELRSLGAVTAHTANCTCICLHAPSNVFATGSYDGTACIWDAVEMACLRPCCTSLEEGIGGLGISHDGAVVAGINEDDHSSAARVDRLIDLSLVATGETVLKLETRAQARRLAWHPSQLLLAYSGEKGSSEARAGEWGRDGSRRTEVPVVIAGLAHK